MPDEPLALSPIPPAVPADDVYDAICAALRRTERGRRFLEEHARRNRNADAGTVIGAIEPVNTLIPAVHARETQTDVLAAVERLQDLAWTMREYGLDMANCEHIEILASTILSASWLRDPGDRRAQKLGEALSYLERRIDSLIAAVREHAREHAEAPFREIAVPIEGAPEPAPTDGVNEPSADLASVAAPSELSASRQMEPASIVSDKADALPVEPAADRNTGEIAAEAATVRVPTMWEPQEVRRTRPVAEPEPADFLLEPLPVSLKASAPAQPEVPKASPRQPLPYDFTADDELFAAPPTPALQAAPGAPQRAAPGPAPIASMRSDLLAALNTMSDEEKIAIFT